MTSDRLLTPLFVKVWIAGLLQELSFSLMVHFPGFLEDLGATESRIGLLYAASAVVALLIRPLVGRVMDQTSRRSVLLGVGIANVTTLVALISLDALGLSLFAVFIAHRVLQIVLFTAMLTYAADSLPAPRRTQGLGIFGLAGLVPIATGGVIGDVVIGAVGFDGLFIAAAVAELASLVVVWSLPRIPLEAPVIGARRTFFAALAQRDLVPMWWIALMFAAGLETLFTYMRTFVDERQVGTVGLFFGVYGTMAIAVRLLGGPHMDRVPPRLLLVWTTIAYGTGVAMVGQAAAVPLLVLGAVVAGLGHGLMFPVLSAQIVSRARLAERGSAMAIFTSIFDLALLTIAPATGFVIDGRGYPTAFTAVGLLLVVGAVVYGYADRATSPQPGGAPRPAAPEAV